MCGINLIIEKKQDKGKDAIAAMTLQTAHRGPDNQQIISLDLDDYKVHLGFNRLSIWDADASAHQPMFSPCRQYLLMFNGEIYNHLALKKILRDKGIQFTTHSDTEVLLHWLKTYGTDGLAQLDGMFALVWIDLQSRSVFLGRDKMGMKPLFMANIGDTVVVSSVLQGVMASGMVSRKLNHFAIQHYLQFRYAQAPDTFFEEVKELLPGSLHTFHTTKGWSQSRIAESDSDLSPNNLEDSLMQSVREHLQADVSGGIFLSGGADSTLLLALAHEQGINVPSFCIHTGHEQDLHFARKAAKLFKSDLHEVNFGKEQLQSWPEFIAQVDQPIADTAAWLTNVLSAEAKKSVKFVLSGAGADELFAGYHRHQAFQWYLKNPQLVTWAIRFKGILLKAASIVSDEKKRLITRWVMSLNQNPAATFLHFMRLRILIHEDLHLDILPENWLNWAFVYDQEHYLVGDVLAVSDRMSMQNGLEMRMPYLSKQVVQWARNANPEALLKNGRKTPIHQLLIKHNLSEFTTRSKYGFGLPVAHWIRNGAMDDMFAIIKDVNAKVYQFVDYSHVKTLLQSHLLGKDDYSAELYAIVLLAHWLDRNT